jgi:hypothetical protein
MLSLDILQLYPAACIFGKILVLVPPCRERIKGKKLVCSLLKAPNIFPSQKKGDLRGISFLLTEAIGDPDSAKPD